MLWEKRSCTSSTASIAAQQCNAQQVFRRVLHYQQFSYVTPTVNPDSAVP